MRRLVKTAAMLAALLASPALAANVELGYGGRLTDDADKALPGPVNLVVRFFNSASGGTPLTSALNFDAVALDDGVFQLTLSLTPSDANIVFSGATWLEITDSTNGKTYPRQRLMTVPYALRVPVDGTSVAYDANGQLTVVAVPQAGVTGLAAALAGKSDATHSHTLAGDVTGAVGTTVVAKLQGRPVSSNSPAAGDFLKWNSTSSVWEPGGVAGASGGTVTGVTAGTGLAGGTITTSGTVSVDFGSAATQVAAGNHTHPAATSGVAGFLSAADKTVLDAATDANTASALVKRDASGNFAAGTITASLAGNASTATTATSFSSALAGDVSGTQSATAVTKIQGRAVASAAPAAGSFLKWNNTSTQWEPNTDGSSLTALNATNVASGTLAVARGGTGVGTTPANGQLLIGDGTGWQIASLTSGSGISLTAGAGSLTVAATSDSSKLSLAGGTMTGALQGALGTVLAPGYTFSGDTNTGVWSSGADTLNVATGGSERLRIDSSGNVGIGTTTPAATLDVTSPAAGTSALIARSASSPTVPTIDARNSGNQTVFSVNEGKVVIGSYNAAVYPTLELRDNNSPQTWQIRGKTGGGMPYLTFRDGSGSLDRVVIDSSGFVGIGTTAPTSTLQIAGSLGLNVNAVASSSTLGATDGVVLVNATGGAVTITLPIASSATGRLHVIKKTDTTANIVTVGSTSTIDGAGNIQLKHKGSTITVVSDGSAWSLVSSEMLQAKGYCQATVTINASPVTVTCSGAPASTGLIITASPGGATSAVVTCAGTATPGQISCVSNMTGPNIPWNFMWVMP